MSASRSALVLTTIVVVAAGCGADNDDEGASSSGTVGPDEPRTCEPVNAELETIADQTVEIGASEFAFSDAVYEAAPGTITFEVTNNGGEEHELAFLPGGGDVPYTDGKPDEAALEAAGAFELEAFGPGRSCNATYEFAAGAYTLFCIVRTTDGENHYDKGMRATLTVAE